MANEFFDFQENTRARDVSCPTCECTQTITPVTVLHSDTDELEKLFQGHLNTVTCSSCHAQFRVQAPLLFRDDEHRFLVYYAPLEDRGKWDEAEKQMRQITANVFGNASLDELPDCRLTLTRRSFIEKIALHLDGLDDRVVEYVKYQLYNNPEQNVDAVRYELLYDFTASDDDKLAFILFDRESGTAQAATHIPRHVYEEVAEAFLKDDDMREELEALFSGYYVNVEKLLFG
ncbi:MAG: hypothetical protein K9N51_06070 [Candidatus Pacebacteria bacterium]|nr:hypothetical protein [Candidatus Paceibacterota bacterium]